MVLGQDGLCKPCRVEVDGFAGVWFCTVVCVRI